MMPDVFCIFVSPMKDTPHIELELLAPARDAATARQAVLHGADAVYIGGPAMGARQAAGNSVADIAALASWCHVYGARVYVTLNTLLLDEEVPQAVALARQLYRAGVDALIIQDMALLEAEGMPPIELHASTQCDIQTADKARLLAAAGISRLVLPRELSLDEIRAMAEAVPGTGIEAFVHGALCVSHSGDCQAGQTACGRSGNRGACPQICRLPYDLVDASGSVLARGRHLLSLKDMCRIDQLQQMADAGVTSFKIEGRLKDAGYVKNVVAAYSRRLDDIVAASQGRYRRASRGDCRVAFEPDVSRSFNRGFTPYLLDGRRPAAGTIVSFDSPKAVGIPLGTCRRQIKPGVIEAELLRPVANGDGIAWTDPKGRRQGARVNRAEGGRLFLASTVKIAPGTPLSLTSDTQWERLMTSQTATRTIAADMSLALCPDGRLRLSLSHACGPQSAVTVYSGTPLELKTALKPQAEIRRKTLAALGDTPFALNRLKDDSDPSLFIPASLLADLRRKGIEALTRQILLTNPYCYRLPEKPFSTPSALTYHDNVGNATAERWYRRHGTRDIEPALETGHRPEGPFRVMTTRHCLRRETGHCPKDNPKTPPVAEPWTLVHGSQRWQLEFDCRLCRMHLIAPGKGSGSGKP